MVRIHAVLITQRSGFIILEGILSTSGVYTYGVVVNKITTPKGERSMRIDERFREKVCELVGTMSLREAMRLTGITHTTIMTMLEGQIPRRETVIRFAEGFNQDINAWLELAGYHETASSKRSQSLKPHDHQLDHLDDPKADMIEIAYRQVQADPTYRFGNRSSGELLPIMKYDIIRLYERATGKRLLPEGFYYP